MCPADIILIFSSEFQEKQQICFVDSHLITGKVTYEIKKTSNILNSTTKSMPSKQLPKLNISCTIEYSYPNKEIDSFIAYIKLANDPKIEKLTSDNFIQRGCVIKKAKWIIGIVVYTGKDTKLMKNFKFKFNKSSFLEYVSQIYFLTICLILIICSLVTYYFKFI